MNITTVYSLFNANSYDVDWFMWKLLILSNRFWFMQTTICMLYCVVKRRLQPVKKEHFTKSFFILQFLFMLTCNSMIYLIQLLMLNNWITKFDTCLHHLFSICIFIQTTFEPNIISAIYLLPFFTHTIYWSNIIDHENVLLVIYYFSFLIATVFLINRNIFKEITYKIPFYGILISIVNLFWYFHGDDLNIFEFQSSKASNAIIKSFAFNLPILINFYLIQRNRKVNASIV